MTNSILTSHKVDFDYPMWANQLLVIPLNDELNVSRGDRINLSINYKAGTEIEVFYANLRASR